MVRAFDLISKQKGRPRYPVSGDENSHKTGTKLADKLFLSLVVLRCFSNQPHLVMPSCGGPLSTTLQVLRRNAIKHLKWHIFANLGEFQKVKKSNI